MRQKLPFGIAQIGKAFRNEITTKNFLFRTREFEQMEMQCFCRPGTQDDHFEYWREERWNWFRSIGLPEKKLSWHEHQGDELPTTPARPSTYEMNSPSAPAKLRHTQSLKF